MATSVAPAFKAALHTALVAAYPATVQVLYGRPGVNDWLAEDVVALLDVDATQDATVMGTRAREERFSLTVLVSSARGGGTEVQRTVTEAAYALLATLETTLRTDPGVTATCRKAEVVGHLMAEDETTTGDGVLGRVCEIAASIAVQARI